MYLMNDNENSENDFVIEPSIICVYLFLLTFTSVSLDHTAWFVDRLWRTETVLTLPGIAF